MRPEAQTVLEQFKALSLDEQRQVAVSIFRQWPVITPAFRPSRGISDVAGKYHALLDLDAKDHDRGFADSIG